MSAPFSGPPSPAKGPTPSTSIRGLRRNLHRPAMRKSNRCQSVHPECSVSSFVADQLMIPSRSSARIAASRSRHACSAMLVAPPGLGVSSRPSRLRPGVVPCCGNTGWGYRGTDVAPKPGQHFLRGERSGLCRCVLGDQVPPSTCQSPQIEVFTVPLPGWWQIEVRRQDRLVSRGAVALRTGRAAVLLPTARPRMSAADRR